jgi:hypothetical protein
VCLYVPFLRLAAIFGLHQYLESDMRIAPLQGIDRARERSGLRAIECSVGVMRECGQRSE